MLNQYTISMYNFDLHDLEKAQKKFANGVLILGVIGIIFLPLMLTFPAIISLFDYSRSSTGNIGNTIGGITAPIIGLVTASLMYIAFRAQWEANKIQFRALKEAQKKNIENEAISMIWKLYDSSKSDIDSNYFVSTRDKALNANTKIYQRRIDIIRFMTQLNEIFLQIRQFLIMVSGYENSIIKKEYLVIFTSQIRTLFTRLMPDYYHVSSNEFKDAVHKNWKDQYIFEYENLSKLLNDNFQELYKIFKDKNEIFIYSMKQDS